MVASSDQRHLLLALLAFQNGFISQPQLFSAFNSWIADQSPGIDRYLVDQGSLTSDQLSQINHFVDLHIQRFDGNLAQSLASLSGSSSDREPLMRAANEDAEALQSILMLPQSPPVVLTPQSRYPTANELKEEDQRWPDDAPDFLLWKPFIARFTRWMRYHPAITSGVAASLLLAMVGLTIFGVLLSSYIRQLSQKNQEIARNAPEVELNSQEVDAQYKEISEKAFAIETELARSNIFLSISRLEEGRTEAALEYLARIPPQHRNFEWYFTFNQCDASKATLYGHTPFIRVAFNPDRTRIASASEDGAVRIWDVGDGNELHTFRGHSEAVTSLAFSLDGTRIASGSRDSTIKLWDVVSGMELHTFSGHTSFISSVAFSPDGMQIVSGSGDTTIKLWDVVSGNLLRTLRGHSGGLLGTDDICVAFSPDGTWIASGSEDNTIKLWMTQSGNEVRTLTGHTDNLRGINKVVFSPDGTRIASGSGDNTIKIWDAIIGTELHTLRGHIGEITSVTFGPDGMQIASAGEDRTIKLWNTDSGNEIRTLSGHTQLIDGVAFSLDGMQIVSASRDGTIKYWDADSESELRIFRGHTSAIRNVAFSPDGTRMVSAGEDRAIILWNTASGHKTHTLRGHNHSIFSLAFSPDGTRIASGSWDGTIKLWDAVGGTELRSLSGHSDGVSAVAFSPDGRWIASAGGYDKTIKLLDAESGTELRTLSGHTAIVNSVAFSPDGTRIASGSLDQTIKLWDAISGTELRTLSSHTDSVRSVAFSPDGTRIASASFDNTIKLWDPVSGTELRSLGGHDSGFSNVVFSPDGTRIAAGSDSIKLWDTISGIELLSLNDQTGVIRNVAFSPDGTRIASVRDNGTIKLWDAPSDNLASLLVGQESKIQRVQFDSASQLIYTSTDDGNEFVYSINRGELLETVPADVKWIKGDVSPDGRSLAYIQGSAVRLVDLQPNSQPENQERRKQFAVARFEWHRQRARIAEKGSDWYAALFHSACEINSLPYHFTRDRLDDNFAKLKTEFDRREQNVNDFLPAIVNSALNRRSPALTANPFGASPVDPFGGSNDGSFVAKWPDGWQELWRNADAKDASAIKSVGNQLLSDTYFEPGNASWNMQFATWLMLGREPDRIAALQQSEEAAEQDSEEYSLDWLRGWVLARNGKSTDSGEPLKTLGDAAAHPGCEFQDLMFYAVALRTAGQLDEALAQARSAKEMLHETWGDPETIAQLPAVDQICLKRLGAFIDRLIDTLAPSK